MMRDKSCRLPHILQAPVKIHNFYSSKITGEHQKRIMDLDSTRQNTCGILKIDVTKLDIYHVFILHNRKLQAQMELL